VGGSPTVITGNHEERDDRGGFGYFLTFPPASSTHGQYVVVGDSNKMAQVIPAARTIQNFHAEVECRDCNIDETQVAQFTFRLMKHVPLGEQVESGVDCTTPRLTDSGGTYYPGNGFTSCISAATVAVGAGERLFIRVDYPAARAPAPGPGAPYRYGDISLRWAFELA
jgi:hypothetical protein